MKCVFSELQCPTVGVALSQHSGRRRVVRTWACPDPALLGRAVWNKLQPCRVLSGPLGAVLASVVWTRAGAAVRGHPMATSPKLWPQRMAVSWGSRSQVPEGQWQVFVSTQVYIVTWKCSSLGFQFVFTSSINCVTSGLKRS